MAHFTTSGDNHLDSGIISGLFSGTTPHSQILWMNIPSYSTTISPIGSFNSGNTAFQIGARNNTLTVWQWGGGTIVLANPTPPTNEWFHCAYVWDGSTNYLYINGSLNNTSTNTPQSGTLNQIWTNGYTTGGSAETGTDFGLTDYRIYNRVLSSLEVETIYTVQGADQIINGLVGRWQFFEGPPGGNVVSAVDISGSGYDLSPTGTNTYGYNPLSFRR